MAQTGYSPILIYGSTTTGNTPAAGNLTTGTSGVELAINATDGKLFYKDNAGVVQTIATKAGAAGTFSNVTITGGSINGTTIGATTASTGAFTTLSASSTVSGTGFSTYLASPPAIGSTAANTGAFTTLSASSTTTLSGGTANGVAYLNGSKVVTTGSALVFDGTNLSVGSILDGGKLTLSGAAGFAGTGLSIFENSTGNNARLRLSQQSGAVVYDATFSTGGNQHVWQIGSSEQMRLTSTGLGIGTSSPGYKLDVVGSASRFSNNTVGGFQFQLNNTQGTSFKSQISWLANGASKFSIGIDPSGAGANNFYWYDEVAGATRMTLDSSGNLGLGVTPSAWAGASVNYNTFQFGVSSVTNVANTAAEFAYNQYIDSGGTRRYINTNTALRYRMGNTDHAWFTAASGTAGTAITFTQAMTLDASGRLVVGATSTAAKFQVSGASANTYLLIDNAAAGENYFAANSANIFQTAGSERARINSSGQLLIGGTNAGAYGAILVQQLSSGTVWSVGPITGQTSKWYVINGSGTGVYLGDGNTSWTANSDERLKDIIEPIENAASKVLSLRAVIGKYKTDDEGTRRSFLIAQDVQAVLPEAVDASNPESLGVQYTDVIPLLVAAIKEQSALITQLTERITALEGK